MIVGLFFVNFRGSLTDLLSIRSIYTYFSILLQNDDMDLHFIVNMLISGQRVHHLCAFFHGKF